jgi:LPPG:FO 2-phospho-L-lactate transferase
MIVALAGGVGGAKLALGLTHVEAPDNLIIAVNTGDDFEHLGLHISPDLDSVAYALAGIENPATGWGVANETWSFMDQMARLGGETWFNLGDRDLAVHVERTRRLKAGSTLSEVTAHLCRQLGIRHRVLPMTDDTVRTIVLSGGERISFQHYFVKLRCEPAIDGLDYEGAGNARPSPQLLEALRSPALEGIVVCPSNPYLSIGPMLAMPAIRDALKARTKPAVVVSPIIGGAAVKGPAAKIMRELGQQPSCLSVAEFYRGLVDAILIDKSDAVHAPAIEQLGMRAVVSDIMMRDLDDRQRLARECCALIRGML